MPVEPFPLPEVDAAPDVLAANAAVRLFVERSRAVDPRFVLTDANAATIAAICRRLDGLPLAIELAAARTKMLSPEALLAQLPTACGFCAAGSGISRPPADDARHDRLELRPARRQSSKPVPAPGGLRRWLHVGRGRIRRGGAWLQGEEGEEECGDPLQRSADVLDDIGALVDQSLVRHMEGAGEPRFTMLETIREFGLEQLANAGEEEIIRGRHAACFRQLAEEL